MLHALASIVEYAVLHVFSAVPRKFLKRSVAEAFQEQRWPRDVEGGLSMIGLFEYF